MKIGLGIAGLFTGIAKVYFLEEAVEEVPEYVVPWEAFRALVDCSNSWTIFTDFERFAA